MDLLKPIVEKQISQRTKIKDVHEEEKVFALREVLEELADSMDSDGDNLVTT